MESAGLDDYFKLDSEAHVWPDTSDIKYFPGFQWEEPAFQGVARILGIAKQWETKTEKGDVEFPKSNDPEVLIQLMDKYGVDMACILPESGWGKTHIRPITTNGFIMAACEKYPDRFVFTAIVPVTTQLMFKFIESFNRKLLLWHLPEQIVQQLQLIVG